MGEVQFAAAKVYGERMSELNNKNIKKRIGIAKGKSNVVVETS
jgi:hypothetical protein